MAAVTFHTAWQRYQHHLRAERHRSRHTVATYRTALTEFEAFLRPRKRWDQATDRDVARFLDRPRRGHGARRGGPLSPASRACYAGAIRVFYQWACREGLIRRDPMAALVLPKGGRAIPRAVPTKGSPASLGLDTLLAYAATDQRLEVMVLLAARSGLRVAEIAGLRREHCWLGPDAKIRVMGKGSRERVVPLHPKVKTALASYLARRSGSGPVVEHPTRPGEHVTPRWVSRQLGRVLHELGIQTDSGTDATAHSLRHAAATSMLAAGKGKNLRAVQRFLGHASPQTTQIYTLGYDEDVAQSVAELAAADAKAGAL
jgi:integrase/recombinase XerC